MQMIACYQLMDSIVTLNARAAQDIGIAYD
jgi:hypothetical protein